MNDSLLIVPIGGDVNQGQMYGLQWLMITASNTYDVSHKLLKLTKTLAI